MASFRSIDVARVQTSDPIPAIRCEDSQLYESHSRRVTFIRLSSLVAAGEALGSGGPLTVTTGKRKAPVMRVKVEEQRFLVLQ
jgi:hypothetical protein